VAGLTDWGAWSWVSFDVFVFFACTLEFAVSKHIEIDMFFFLLFFYYFPLSFIRLYNCNKRCRPIRSARIDIMYEFRVRTDQL